MSLGGRRHLTYEYTGGPETMFRTAGGAVWYWAAPMWIQHANIKMPQKKSPRFTCINRDRSARCIIDTPLDFSQVSPMRPEELLPDDTNETERGGVVIRKGTVGAFLASVQVWRDPAASANARATAEADMVSVLPAMQALGLFEVFELRDPVLRELVQRCLQDS